MEYIRTHEKKSLDDLKMDLALGEWKKSIEI
jgi:hypothetical protein